MKVNWIERPDDSSGNHLGFAVHNRESRAAFTRAGGEVDKASEMSLVVQAPFYYEAPINSSVNGLYTAWDTTMFPKSADSVRQADFIIVTATYLVPVFRKLVGDRTPIYVCPLGVHADRFAFKGKRRLKCGERMRVLWVGAPNQRKGYPFILGAVTALQQFPFDFYLKTTTQDGEEKVTTDKVGPHARVIVDSRKLPLDELIELYHKANVFLFPSMGEGFGLTLAEAMASGLPCVFTPWSAMTDYCDARVAFPLGFDLIEADINPNLPKDWEGYDDYCGKAELAHARVESICERLVWIFSHYKRAQAKGQLAAARIRSKYTWEHTGRRLLEILEEVERRWLRP